MNNEKKVYAKPEIAALGRLDRFINDMAPPPYFYFDGKTVAYGKTAGGAKKFVRQSMSLP